MLRMYAQRRADVSGKNVKTKQNRLLIEHLQWRSALRSLWREEKSCKKRKVQISILCMYCSYCKFTKNKCLLFDYHGDLCFSVGFHFYSAHLCYVYCVFGKKGKKIWKESFRELPECIVSTGVWLKDDIPVSSIHNIADMHVILVYACILYGAAVWNLELKTEESLSWMWRGGRSGRAGHSHKSDLHSVRSMQADVWKCLCPTWTFNSVTLDNPQQVNSGFSLSVAG